MCMKRQMLKINEYIELDFGMRDFDLYAENKNVQATNIYVNLLDIYIYLLQSDLQFVRILSKYRQFIQIKVCTIVHTK